MFKVLLRRIEELLQQKQKEPPTPRFTSQFVPEGREPPKSSRRHVGLLDRAKDWILLADICSSKLIFPPSIMSTAERPDIVIYSSQIHSVILIENTSGCEENHDENHTLKTEKYNSLVDHIRGTGWECHFFTIEVGARGFNSSRVPYCLKALGFSPRMTRKILPELSRAALVGSYHIWLARNDKSWIPDPVCWEPTQSVTSSSSLFSTVSPSTSVASSPIVVDLPSTTAPPITTSTAVRIEPAAASKVSANVLNQSSSSSQVSSQDIDFAVHPGVIDAATCTEPTMVDLTSCPEAQASPVVIDLSSEEQDSLPDSSIVSQSELVLLVTPAHQLPGRCVPTSSRSPIFPPSALCNLGNTCYANAILYSFFFLPELWKVDQVSHSDRPMLKELKAILMVLNSSRCPVKPMKFLESLQTHIVSFQTDVPRSRQFSYNRQQDSFEALGYITA